MSKKKEQELNYRAASFGPKTLNEDERSLEFVISTETPVKMYDWERGEYVPEVLLAQGAVMPRQVPLLDTHSRWGVGDVLGSVRNKKVEESLISGKAFFSSVEKADEALTKYREGHLTDFSAGYVVNNKTYIPKGKKSEIAGRSWRGPMNVVTTWTVKEVSCCPIGADAKAKARNDNNNHEVDDMDEKRFEEVESGLTKLTETVGGLVEGIKPVIEQANKTKNIDDADLEIKNLRENDLRKKELQVANERTRINEINEAAQRLGDSLGIDFEEIRIEMIESGASVADANKRFMDRVTTAKPGDITDGIRVGITKEERDKSREAVEDGLLIRAGIALDEVGDKNSEFQDFTLFEIAKSRLHCANESTKGLDKMQVFERALSTSDFDNILANVANKAVLDGFEKAEETYSVWADTSGRVSDFKAHEFSRASEAPTLLEINPDGGEYKYGSMSDKKESVTAVDYGIIVPFTRKAMVNDDLGALSDIREKLGAAAARKYGDLVYSVLTASHTMGDSNELWDASNHGNYTASGAAPSVTTLNTGYTAMATQTNMGGLETLNIIPQYILGPHVLKATIDGILHPTTPVVVGSDTKNPWAYLTPVHDARLDTASSTVWYLAGRKGMTVKLFTMNGNMAPKLESRAGWATDGMEFKARVTAAAKAMDWVGLYKNAGA